MPIKWTPKFVRELSKRFSLAACALPVDVVSTVGMHDLDRDRRKYIAANAERIRELGFETPTLKFENGDVPELCCRFEIKVVLSLRTCARNA